MILMIDGGFDPNAPCTRASAVTYIWRAFGSPDAAEGGFADVPASAGYAAAVSWAVELGVTDGFPGTSSAPANMGIEKNGPR